MNGSEVLCVSSFAPCACKLRTGYFPLKGFTFMRIKPALPSTGKQGNVPRDRVQARAGYQLAAVAPFHLSSYVQPTEPPQRHAELFYLQKQIQAQTPMVLVLEGGEVVEGCIEWYDQNALKVRGNSKTLVYKSAIKYMYKQGDVG
jgi:sRNA-binding regulator protein Hfq